MSVRSQALASATERMRKAIDRMSNQPDWIITSEQLKSCLSQVKLVDVREPEEHAEGHIAGDVLIPLGDIQVRGPAELNPEDEIVIYCAHGMRSLQALMALRMQGFEKLRSLEGGFEAWKEAVSSNR